MNHTKLANIPSVDYQALFESLPGRYIVALPDDPTFTIVAQSAAHAEMTMVSPGEIIGKPSEEAFPDTSEQYKKTGINVAHESLRKVIQTGKPHKMSSFRFDIKDGTNKLVEKYWQVTHYPIIDANGKVSLLVSMADDITDETDTVQKLALAERQLEEALSTGMIGTWIWDIPSNKVIANRNMAAIFSVPEKEAAKGLPISAFTHAMHPDDRPAVQKAIEKTIKSKGTFEHEYRTIGQDGATRWVLARGRIEQDENGNAKTFPGVLVDITERKLIENNLSYLAKASAIFSSSLDYKKTLQTIAQLTVPDIADWCSIEILDEKNQLKQVAVAHKDPKKVKWARDYREKQGPPPLDAPTGVPKVLRTGKPEFYPDVPDELLVAASKDKEELELARSLGFSSVIVVPLKVHGETIGGISLVSAELKRHYTKSDLEMAEELASRASLAITNASLYESSRQEIAERKRLQEELRLANEDLELRVKERTSELEKLNIELLRSNSELEGFAYVASHDLQEPLRKIQAFSNLLESEYSDRLGDGKDYVHRMRNAAERMSILIRDLLEFSRVTTKGQEFSEVNLSMVAGEVINDLQTRIEDTGGQITLDRLPTISADPIQMRQLLQNLIGNALKFHKQNEAPDVTITSSLKATNKAKTKYCTITVTDSGVGFDEKYLDRIFAVFQRLHGRDVYEGTGIGLAVCRKIVERHGGTITAKSKPGKGSAFIVTLPVKHKKEHL